jgi:carbohydrate kinase (thermoresistant glucokinase family)
MQAVQLPVALPSVIVVMGVSGSGKTTIGEHLASALGWMFAEGDSFHSPANIAKMARGTPLTDEDRWPWLAAIADWIRTELQGGRSSVIACSALKRAYRDRLREGWPALILLYLQVDRGELERRLGSRCGHFFPERLLDSQLADLEPPQTDESAIVVPPSSIEAELGRVAALLGRST